MSWVSTLGRIGLGAAGTALGGPFGGAIGARLGGALGGALEGIVGGGRDGRSGTPASSPYDANAAALRGELTTTATGPVTMGPAYMARLKEILRLTKERETSDTASAAARGLTGTGFEVALSGQRAREATRAQTAALDASVAERSAAQARLLALLGLDARRDEAQAARDEAGKQRTAGVLGSVFSAAVPAGIRLGESLGWFGDRGVPTDPERNPSSEEMLGRFR